MILLSPYLRALELYDNKMLSYLVKHVTELGRLSNALYVI